MRSAFFIYVFVLLTVLASCGTQKKVVMSQETDTKVEQKKDDSLKVTKVKDTLSVSFESAGQIVESADEIVMEREVFSKPDSSGRQYMTTREQVRIKSPKKESKAIYSGHVENRSEEHDSSVVASSSFQEHESVRTAIREKKGGVSPWRRMLGYAGLTALLAVVLWILIRRLKWKLL